MQYKLDGLKEEKERLLNSLIEAESVFLSVLVTFIFQVCIVCYVNEISSLSLQF